MGSVCADHHHKFHPAHQLYLSKKSLDIPPRKLLSRRSSFEPASAAGGLDAFLDSPRSDDSTIRQKFLPYNRGADDSDDDADPYSSDHFRMYEFKVRRCTRSRSHDWTDCPFAHPGEKARRRDPRRCHYSGTVCSEFRRGSCSRGDNCEFAHGVFECWLHPARYRTEACKDGKNCKRKVCFFAHTPRQLRVLPPSNATDGSSYSSSSPSYRSSNNHCCAYCHCACAATSSPTSTLMSMSNLSPPLSPPLSPENSAFSPISRFGDRLGNVDLNGYGSGGLNYKEALTELMSNLEAMNVNTGTNNRNLPWVDVSDLGFNHNGSDEQQQFILSPSTPNPVVSGRFFGGDYGIGSRLNEERFSAENWLADPDLGWVNDLLT